MPSRTCAPADAAPVICRRSNERQGAYRVLTSFKWAGDGLGYLWKTQLNARIHAVAAVLVIALAGILRVGVRDWALLVFAITLVLVAEGLNTALEATVDLVTSEIRPLAKAAKDTAAAAVLLSAIGAAIIGSLVLGPPFREMVVALLGV